MTVTALIADDEPHLAAHLGQRLADLWPDLQIVRVARNGLEAAEAIAMLQPDLAFLDIRMPGIGGLEVAQGIEGATRVVFVTAYDEFAVAAFEREAIDYVLKPVTAERLERTIERVRRALSRPAPSTEDVHLAEVLRRVLPGGPAAPARLRHVRASRGELTHQIDVADVLFFRAGDKYTGVQTEAAEYLIRTSIVELAAQLDPDRFWQVHRSTLVNVDRVAGTRRDDASRLHLRLRGWPHELPVSRAYVHLFRAM